MRKWLLFALAFGLVTYVRPVLFLSQTPAVVPPVFEVASIKLAEGGYKGGSCRGKETRIPSNLGTVPLPPLGRCIFSGATLSEIVRYAYSGELQNGVQDLVSGGPKWVAETRFDVEAKAAEPDSATPHELVMMLQSLLSERFNLRLHRSKKDVEGFALVVAKGGLKLKPAQSNDSPPGTLRPTRTFLGGVEWTGKAVPLSTIVLMLSGGLGPVIDRTGLTGLYSFTLTYNPETALTLTNSAPRRSVPSEYPSIMEALTEQLGLRLESEKISVTTIVIDSATKPSDN